MTAGMNGVIVALAIESILNRKGLYHICIVTVEALKGECFTKKAKAIQRKKVFKLNDKYESQMKKGVLDMLVLKLLSEREMYGYQIISELAELSDQRFLLKEGTLYPILYRLEDDGQIVSHWSEAEGKRVARKYYAVTEAGKRTLTEIQTLWKELSGTVDRIMED